MIKKFIILIAITMCFGCSTKGFNRGDLKEQTGIASAGYDDKDIQSAFEKSGNLPKKFKMAVYFKAPPSDAKKNFNEWRWTENDKAKLDSLGKELVVDGIAAEVFPILSSVVIDDDLKSLRMVAAKHQADALLIVSGASQIERRINTMGWSYALILPTLFIPGSDVETLFISSATLWDVKNEYLYLTAEAESIKSERYAAAFARPDQEIVNSAKLEAVEKLGGELRKMIAGKKF